MRPFMKRLLLSGLMSLMLFPGLGRATDDTYVNNGDITFPPQIDATNVINNGSFDFRSNPTELPFDTSNTHNFTNNGTMIATVGFQFDNAPSTGPRKLAANFVNRLTGVITAVDGQGFAELISGNFTLDQLIIPSRLQVSATNLINQGSLTAGAGGLMSLVGTNIDLTRSGIQIRPITPQGSVNEVSTNYFLPDVAIYDNYWGQTNQTINSGNIIQVAGGNVTITAPSSRVDFPYNRFGFRGIQLRNPYGDFYTNTVAFTNIAITNATGEATTTNVASTNIVQAVFVGLPVANNIGVGVRFADSSNFENPFKTVAVGVQMQSTNMVTLNPELTSLYLVDTLASETNRSYYTNFLTVTTLRPQNYLLERITPFEFFFGFSGNADFAPDLLYQTNFVSRIVTNDYAAYSAFVDNIASRPPNIPAGTVTNLPGRIEVFANSLDLTKTRFRADGLLSVNAKHLVSSTNTMVDCENLSYDLGSTNGNLKIEGLAQESVARFTGDNYVWSGFWTNYQNMIIESYEPDPDDTNNFILAPITNVVEYRIYAMVYNTQELLTQVPVVVNSLATHSTNVAVNDKMTVVQKFLIDGDSFTLNGGITFSNTFFTDTRGNTVIVSLENWVNTNAPTLKYFTNNGTLNIPNVAHFGDDRPVPYAAFVNRGTINAFGQTINSDYCELAGNNNTAAEFTLITRSGKAEAGTVTSGGDAVFYADVLKFNQSTIQTDSRLDLTVTNSLFDAGGGAGNAFSCRDGFRLLIKPQTGDLLGTSLRTIAPSFASVSHSWAGLNLGASPVGFANNVALGQLSLTPEGYDPFFVFSGAGGNNGLYVDVLDLSQLSDYANQIQINPSLVIYYAGAKLGFTPPLTNGVAQQPEEYLNGQFGGRLQWVRDFAGPNSSVDAIVNGQTTKVNRALRSSLIIDSDGDGIPNGFDFYPFDLIASLGVTSQPSLTAVLSWNGTAQTVYEVQSAASQVSPNWQTVRYYTNTATTNGKVTVQIPVPPGSSQQFYRVGVVSP